MRLSQQAIGAICMAIQKGFLEQTDITEVLEGFEVICDEDGDELFVTNVPTVDPNLVKIDEDEENIQ
jgi:hypothetical protein